MNEITLNRMLLKHIYKIEELGETEINFDEKINHKKQKQQQTRKKRKFSGESTRKIDYFPAP